MIKYHSSKQTPGPCAGISFRNPDRRRLHQKSTRSAFALLLVISCLFLVSGALIAISRQNLELVLESADSADDFRRRWTEYSLEQSSLTLATQLYGSDPGILLAERIKDAPEPRSPSLPRWKPLYEFGVRLNDVQYQVTIADESAKFNVNTAKRLRPPQPIQQSVQRLSQGRVQLMLSTSGQWSSSGSRPNEITSWGQVISLGLRDASSLEVADLESVTRFVTLWGDGKLNLVRASDDALLETSRLILTEAESRRWMDRAKEVWPAESLEKILAESKIKKNSRDALLRILTTRSTSVSVWIQCHDTLLHQVHGVATRAQSGQWVITTTHYKP